MRIATIETARFYSKSPRSTAPAPANPQYCSLSSSPSLLFTISSEPPPPRPTTFYSASGILHSLKAYLYWTITKLCLMTNICHEQSLILNHLSGSLVSLTDGFSCLALPLFFNNFTHRFFVCVYFISPIALGVYHEIVSIFLTQGIPRLCFSAA